MKNDQIDDLDQKILRLIGNNARIPFLEVARECNVSGAAIHQRISKLMENGIIQGSKFLFDWDKIGYETSAFIGVSVPRTTSYEQLIEKLKGIPQIVECHYSTGKFDLILKVVAHNNKSLLSLVQQKINPLGFLNMEIIILFENAFRRQVPIGEDFD